MTPDRIHRVRETMASLQVDAIILTSPANRRWATGFTSAAGTAFSTDVAFISADTVDLLVAPIHSGWARGESAVASSVAAHKGQFARSLADYISARQFDSVAIEADALPYPHALSLQEGLPNTIIEFVTNLGEQWRASKDGSEIEALERAAQVTDQVFEELACSLKPGESERDVARRISARLIEIGDGLAFDVIVASGENAARPHHRPGDRRIQPDEPIIIDMGCRIDGYCGDLTRTLWLGEPSQQFRDMYQAVLDAQVATKRVMAAGTSVREVGAAADVSLQDAGYGEYILHSVGHGVGLEIHESPAIRQELDAVLPLNSVVTVEPGLYVPDWGGIRIEDVVVVGESACRTLTSASNLCVA
jgi:Xaa-Pro aminopeptidase